MRRIRKKEEVSKQTSVLLHECRNQYYRIRLSLSHSLHSLQLSLHECVFYRELREEDNFYQISSYLDLDKE